MSLQSFDGFSEAAAAGIPAGFQAGVRAAGVLVGLPVGLFLPLFVVLGSLLCNGTQYQKGTY